MLARYPASRAGNVEKHESMGVPRPRSTTPHTSCADTPSMTLTEHALRWTLGSVFALAIGACGSVPPHDARPPAPAADITYEYPDPHSVAWRFSGGRMWLFDRQAPGGNEQPQRPYDAVTVVSDCSDEALRCLRARDRVFAVPRTNIRVGMSFRSGDADLTVHSCARVSAGRCTVYVVSSDSRPMDQRVPPLEQTTLNDAQRGAIIVFAYDVVRGIIAFDDARNWPPEAFGRQWDLRTLGRSAVMLTLRERSGLLAPR